MTVINGNREQLEGKLQERYGYSKDQVRQQLDDCGFWSEANFPTPGKNGS